MKCPVCTSALERLWEKDIGRSFTGRYSCPRCGPLHISGVYVYSTRRRVLHYHPACTRCGLETVTAVHGETDLFQCCRCHRKFAAEEGRIRQYWAPEVNPPGTGSFVTWQSAAQAAL